jgi:hypothetical protein
MFSYIRNATDKDDAATSIELGCGARFNVPPVHPLMQANLGELRSIKAALCGTVSASWKLLAEL